MQVLRFSRQNHDDFFNGLLAHNALQRLAHPKMMEFWCGHLAPEMQQEWKRRHKQMMDKLESVKGRPNSSAQMIPPQ